MNIVQLQDQLKNFSQDQLIREMQMPTGNAPQYLVLGEIMRRKRMQQDMVAQQAKGESSGTVAEDAIAAAGAPQGGIASMARAMAPQTDMVNNTGVQAMASGGPVRKMAAGDKIVKAGRVYIQQEDGSYLSEDGTQRYDTIGNQLSNDIGGLVDMVRSNSELPQFKLGKSERPEAQPYQPPPISSGMNIADKQYAAPQPYPFDYSPEDLPFKVYPETGIVDPAAARESGLPYPDRRADLEAIKDKDIGTPEPEGASWMDYVRNGLANPGSLLVLANPLSTPESVAEAAAAITGTEANTPPDEEAAPPAQEELPPAPPQTPQTPPGPVGGGAGGAGGGSGGIAGAGGMSSYEQELMDMLQRREKAAQQDKWLALAQVGLNMMSSKQPTLLGAVGESGLKGVEAARAARDQYDKDRLDLLGALEQSRAARAAAAARSAGGSSGAPRMLPEKALSVYDDEIAAIDEALSPMAAAGLSPDQQLALTTRKADLMAERAALRDVYLSQYGLSFDRTSQPSGSGIEYEDVPQ